MFWALTILILLLENCSSDGINIETHRIDKNYFDILIFTQQWPVTACYTWKEKNHGNQCILPSPKEFWTIHGIWPTKLGTKGPWNCQELPFDAGKLIPIHEKLDKYWTSIEAGKPPHSFLSHEWTKHGTCAALLPQLNTEIKYFNQALVWLEQYTMTSLLAQANILPGGSYDVKDIFSVLRKMVGFNPAIGCIKDKASGHSYLLEIKICFDKELKLTNCDGIVNSALGHDAGWKRNSDMITNCDSTKPVFYPSVVPPVHSDVIAETDYEPETPFYRIPFVKLYQLIKILQWATL